MEIKTVNGDGNKNCEWRWVRLKKEFNSLDEAKKFLNDNIEEIINRFNLVKE